MIIKTAEFVTSSSKLSQCPESAFPEYAFIGRSNVGKSSLINMLTDRKKLAKISGTPGKTKLVNHFIINDEWFLVDLPGYGYAKSSKADRKDWGKLNKNYILKRESLVCLFVLIDSRLPLQKIDNEFMQWLGISSVPFVMIFTKTDKLSSSELAKNLKNIKHEMLKAWENLPRYFITSAVNKTGQEELLSYIESLNT